MKYSNYLSAASILGILLMATITGPPTNQAGKIRGVVTDAASGEPMPGASVAIVELQRGAITDQNGEYFLIGVPVGKYDIQASFVGFQTSNVTGVLVLDRQTTEVNFELEEGIGLDEIVVEYERPLIKRDAIGVPRVISSDEYDNVPSSNRPKRKSRVFNPDGAIHDEYHIAPSLSEDYAFIEESGFLDPASEPLSTFSIDVDAASYSNARRMLNDGYRPIPDAVRIEEFINYFDYDYSEEEGEKITLVTELGRAPWQHENQLLHIGLQAERAKGDRRPSNLVFLIDVSGSMSSYDKLDLVVESMKLLTENLADDDRVALVVYAGAAGVVLNSTPGADRWMIINALDRLHAGGTTAGGAGIKLAYEIASENLIEGGNNRVILATDGDFNVGIADTGSLVKFIEKKKRAGIGLTTIGVGTGNLKDSRLESLANKGDGNYYYLDNLEEARKVFVTDLLGTIYTVAKDVKIQIEFNPRRVKQYRLIGYENRALANSDFTDDKKDAGEMGSGHSVTALYEIVPNKSGESTAASLRYQRQQVGEGFDGELAVVKIRYKEPDEDKSVALTERVVSTNLSARLSDNFRFSSAVAMYGMLLKDSDYKGSTTPRKILRIAKQSRGSDEHGYRKEFIRLVKKYDKMLMAAAD